MPLLWHGDLMKYAQYSCELLLQLEVEKVKKRSGCDVMFSDSLVFGIESMEALLY